ncbi:MAG: hypothetical protein WCO63_12615 [Bacteroidota bacterium]
MADILQKELADRIVAESEVKKMHLNSALNIMDLAKSVGSNRTYISSAINNQFNQNFASFVNILEKSASLQYRDNLFTVENTNKER